VFAEVIDLRVLNPFSPDSIVASVSKTGRLLVIDGGWSPCGMAGEVIASVVERVSPATMKKSPIRMTLPFSPAPTSRVLEKAYYTTDEMIILEAEKLMNKIC
jgi:acetoin:2,6-dichlorophenolindophenol oxidoreductase subunit beta